MSEDGGRAFLIGVVIAGVLIFGTWAICNTKSCTEDCAWVAQRYEPAHTVYWTTMECFMHDSKGGCSAYMPVQHSQYVADRWWASLVDVYQQGHEVQVGYALYANPPKDLVHTHFRWKTCPNRGRGW